MSVAALIVAAGRGSRVGAEIPKQYIPLAGVPALRRAVARFLSVDAIAALRVVIHPEDGVFYARAMAGLADRRLGRPVEGAATRAGSVRAGLKALADDAPDNVLIHDAARPFVPAATIRAVLEALETAEGASAALPLADAVWRADAAGFAGTPVARDGLWRAQTPQGFRFAPILAAHRAFDGEAADDIAVARAAGLDIRLIEGAEANYKITTAADLARALKDVETDDD